MYRAFSICIFDTNARPERSDEVKTSTTADILVPGLGMVKIEDCLSQETVDKVREEVCFALTQKMGCKK